MSEARIKRGRSISERIEQNIERITESGCWIWMGATYPGGYGCIWLDKGTRVHRLTYCMHHNCSIESIRGWHVRHRCDNAYCVNPYHLELGTNQDNMTDMVSRGRSLKGELNACARLTSADVEMIRSVWSPRDRQFGASALARQLGVSETAIRQAAKGLRWNHVKGDK